MDISVAYELNILLLKLESWDGQLLFGEGDNTQELSKLLRTSYDSGVLTNYQVDTSKYVGFDGVSIIQKDLVLWLLVTLRVFNVLGLLTSH